jgi:hypothetical protein
MDAQQATRVATWIEEVTAELAVPAPADLAGILDVAKDAAHSVERPAAPVSTYLMGYAVANGADPREVAAAIARLAREFDV